MKEVVANKLDYLREKTGSCMNPISIQFHFPVDLFNTTIRLGNSLMARDVQNLFAADRTAVFDSSNDVEDWLHIFTKMPDCIASVMNDDEGDTQSIVFMTSEQRQTFGEYPDVDR